MSQVRNKRQNNVQAGVFVTLALILGIAVMGVLTKTWERIARTSDVYQVAFPVNMGVGTLSAGSQVRLGGVFIGNVISVKARLEGDTPIAWIDVQFEIEKKYTLYDNASIYARAGLLGSTAWLSITNVGSGSIADNTTKLNGTTNTMVAQLLGLESETNIAKSLDAFRRISEALTDEGGALNMLLGSDEAQSLRDSIDIARDGLVAMNSIMNSTQSVWPAWQQSVTTFLEDSSELPSQLSDTLSEVQRIVKDVQTNIFPNVERSLNSLRETMMVLESISKKYQHIEPNWTSSITHMLSNFDLMSTRARGAIDDIAASPWRLVYRPTDREMAYEQLNAASWQLVNTLSDLRQTAHELHAASLTSDAPQEAASLAESLAASAVSFEQARDALLERIQIDFPNRQQP